MACVTPSSCYFLIDISTYAMYSYVYKHADGRVSYPLCFIYYCPEGCSPVTTMLYAGSRNKVLHASGVTKVSAICLFRLRFIVVNTRDCFVLYHVFC